MEKQQILSMIKEWIAVDEKLNGLRQTMRAHALRKKELSAKLVMVMRDKNIDEIDMAEGKVIKQSKTVKSALSKKHLLACLEQYHKSPEVAKEVAGIILGTRQQKVKEAILMKFS